MKDTGLEFVLSTHEENRPKGRLLFHTTLQYFIISAIMFVLGIVLYNQFFIHELRHDLEVLKFIPFMLFFFGFIALILGILNIQRHETIKVDDNGITITKGKDTKTAMWPDITELKNEWAYYPRNLCLGGIWHFPYILIVTSARKYKIKWGNFTRDELKELFLHIADHAKERNVNMADGLGWLPAGRGYDKIKESGRFLRTREYKILIKIGLVMLLVGAILSMPIIYFGFFNSPWMAAAAVLLFFGCMLLLAGWLGIGEEKKKLENE